MTPLSQGTGAGTRHHLPAWRMNMGNDLVERLNKGCILAQDGLGGVDMNATDALCQEAAARIEALEGALKPFSDAYVNREEWALDSYIGGSNLRNRDLRRAARAINGEE